MMAPSSLFCFFVRAEVVAFLSFPIIVCCHSVKVQQIVWDVIPSQIVSLDVNATSSMKNEKFQQMQIT